MNHRTDSSRSGFSNYVQVPKIDRLRINSELGLNHPNPELDKYSLTPLNSGFDHYIQEHSVDALTANRKSGVYPNIQEDDTNISSMAKSDFCCNRLIPELNSYNLTANSGLDSNHYIQEHNYSRSLKASTGLALYRHPFMVAMNDSMDGITNLKGTTISDGSSKPAPPSVQHYGFLVNESSLSSSTTIQGSSKMSELPLIEKHEDTSLLEAKLEELNTQTSPHHIQNDQNPQELPILDEKEEEEEEDDDLTLHPETMSLSPQVCLPDDFVMPKMDDYKGTSCARTHLKTYITHMQFKGLTDAQIALLFPRTLSGPALLWFMSLNSSRVKSWENVVKEVLGEYGYHGIRII